MDMKHMDFVADLAQRDVEAVRAGEEQYQGSWKRRGGVGAFMMLARKWDRLEGRVGCAPKLPDGGLGDRYDIFAHALADTRPEGILDDIRDLRRYLLLVEAEIVNLLHQRGVQVPELAKSARQEQAPLRVGPEDSVPPNYERCRNCSGVHGYVDRCKSCGGRGIVPATVAKATERLSSSG